jgi:uncharacterized protein (TIGR03083 family)
MPAPEPPGPIDAVAALERVEAALLDLLDTIAPAEWDSATIVPGWRVRHVAGHLLDTALRKLAIVRDGFAPERPASGSADDVRDFVNRVNAEGVQVYGRLSPPVLRAVMAAVSPAYCAWHRDIDPQAPAVFAVSWAGEQESRNWFDTARELTERWHHQAQIRLALGRPALMDRDLYHPVLDCFMRALPHTYRDVAAAPGTAVRIRVEGAAGGDWHLVRGAERWLLTARPADAPVATVTIPQDIAWRLFTKGLSRSDAERLVTIEGDRRLASPVLGAIAIVG